MARIQKGRAAAKPRVPVAQWGPQFVERLHSDLDSHLRDDLSVSTRTSYASHLRQFQAFCDLSGRPIRPDGRLLAAFVIGRVQQNFALTYIRSGVSAVTRWAQENGVPHLSQHPCVVQALKVANKRAIQVQVQKLQLLD